MFRHQALKTTSTYLIGYKSKFKITEIKLTINKRAKMLLDPVCKINTVTVLVLVSGHSSLGIYDAVMLEF